MPERGRPIWPRQPGGAHQRCTGKLRPLRTQTRQATRTRHIRPQDTEGKKLRPQTADRSTLARAPCTKKVLCAGLDDVRLGTGRWRVASLDQNRIPCEACEQCVAQGENNNARAQPIPPSVHTLNSFQKMSHLSFFGLEVSAGNF